MNYYLNLSRHMRHQEVERNILAVDCIVNQLADCLGLPVTVQIGVLLEGKINEIFLVITKKQTLWKKAAPVNTIDNSQT